MDFLENIKKIAKNNKKTIVLPESLEIRTLEATQSIIKEDIANIILVGNKDEILAKAGDLDISGATIIDPNNYEKIDVLIDKFVELRKSKGIDEAKAKEILLNDPLYFGVLLVKCDLADGMVAGAINSTANVLRPSLQIIKTAEGVKTVSAFFLMIVPNCEYGENGVFVFGDCGLCQNPTSEELSAIAKSSAQSFKNFTGKEPRVALLSHSTKGSASHPDVDKVLKALEIAKREHPDLIIDGEFQLDSAIVPEIAKTKAPDSEVAGTANVLIFPDLDAGNIGYKLVQRFAKADAYGPMTQGLAKPVNDLSRGCSDKDIVGVVALTAVQAQQQK
ncbi:phosphate acetyltransferase [[Clostridium] colinum]|uniref:phosphate acetyltransferase n=1 Tax=[Clostridium] colinum TaxID=36835 RepID=UPI002023E4BF|nr:phosphate acetyltransferase [[Clostridium] colinum]